MSSFTFKKTKKDRFILENNDIFFELSAPSIQAHNEFVPLKDSKDILYFYYTVEIYKRITIWDGEDNEISKKKFVTKRDVHDFPGIFEFIDMLKFQLDDDTTVNGQKIDFTNGSSEYRKTLSTNGYFADDVYEVTKIVTENKSIPQERYIVYFGSSYDIQGDMNSVGIRHSYINREDIITIIDFLESFISYAIDSENKNIEESSNLFSSDEGKIYSHNSHFDKENGNVSNIFFPLDKLTICYVSDEKSLLKQDVSFVKVEENMLYLSDDSKIPLDSIFLMYLENESETLLNESEIASYLVNILPKEKKESLPTLSDVEFNKTYGDLLESRFSIFLNNERFSVTREGKTNTVYKETLFPIIFKEIKKILQA